MKIVYYLMTHKDGPQIRRLAAHLLRRESSFVLLHHDAKSSPIVMPRSSNLHVMTDRLSITWGDISQVNAMWKGIEWLQNERFPFDWLLFLSGQDYPIRPLSDIEASLRRTDVDAYVHHELIHENPARDERLYRKVCRKRYFFRAIGIPGIKTIYLKRRHPYGKGMQCYAGSPWLNLSRSAFDYLWSRREMIEALCRYLRRSLCPDETVFQTVLLSDSALRIQNSDKRFTIWRDDDDHPAILTLDHHGQLIGSDAWFARKVDSKTSASLLDCLDNEIASAE